MISRTRRVRKGLYGDCLTVPLELKELDEAGAFTGYAAVFNGIDSQNDVVKRGAFTRSLAEHRTAGSMPPLLWMHDASKPIGRLLACREDAKGLFVDGKLTLGVKQADEAYALLREGAVTGLSIGYKTRHSNQDKETGARVLSDVDLREVSLVALPANPAARVEQVKGLGGVRCDLLARVRSNAQELSRLLSLGRLVKGDQRIQMLGCEAISKSAAHDQAVSCRTIE
ncbi:MAG: HK97 family phage prohead protease [Alphaproteobacteria bacterium]